MECGVRLEAKLQLLFVWMWKCNTAALAHRDSAVFSRGKAAFCCRDIQPSIAIHTERGEQKRVYIRKQCREIWSSCYMQSREYNGKGHPERRPFGRLFRWRCREGLLKKETQFSKCIFEPTQQNFNFLQIFCIALSQYQMVLSAELYIFQKVQIKFSSPQWAERKCSVQVHWDIRARSFLPAHNDLMWT